MIPKIIHYCWFGNNPKTDLVDFCIQSWKKYVPDYQIIEWNEHNFDIKLNDFVKDAYQKKRYAFLSDYVRAFALFNYGGIYLDSDVELKQSLNEFLIHGAFSGFEIKGYPFTALWGSEKEHLWPKMVINYYDKLKIYEETTNTVIVSDILVDYFKADRNNDSLQYLKHNVVIYPSTHFCLDLKLNYATHHFNGSWTSSNIKLYKKYIHRLYYLDQFISLNDKNSFIEQFFIDIEQLSIDKNQTKKDLFSFYSKRISIKDLFLFSFDVIKTKVKLIYLNSINQD